MIASPSHFFGLLLTKKYSNLPLLLYEMHNLPQCPPAHYTRGSTASLFIMRPHSHNRICYLYQFKTSLSVLNLHITIYSSDKLPVALSVQVDLVGDIATGSSVSGVTLFSEKIKNTVK